MPTLPITSISWNYAIQSFLAHLINEKYAQATVEAYRLHLKRLFNTLSKTMPGKVSPDELKTSIIRLKEIYPASYEMPSSQRLLTNCCRSFFRWQAAQCHHQNPAELMSSRKGTVQATVPIQVFEIRKLLTAIRNSMDKHGQRDEALFATYAFTGLRRREVLSIKTIDFKKESALLKVQSKGGGKRWLPIVKPLLNILGPYVNESGQAYSSPFVFSGRKKSQPLSCRQANNRFAKWRNEAGLPKYLTIHSFRAGFATELYKQTADLLLTCRALGHADIKSTCHYIGSILNMREKISKIYPSIN